MLNGLLETKHKQFRKSLNIFQVIDMDDIIRKAFEECNKFIDEHTSKELKEYENL